MSANREKRKGCCGCDLIGMAMIVMFVTFWLLVIGAANTQDLEGKLWTFGVYSLGAIIVAIVCVWWNAMEQKISALRMIRDIIIVFIGLEMIALVPMLVVYGIASLILFL